MAKPMAAKPSSRALPRSSAASPSPGATRPACLSDPASQGRLGARLVAAVPAQVQRALRFAQRRDDGWGATRRTTPRRQRPRSRQSWDWEVALLDVAELRPGPEKLRAAASALRSSVRHPKVFPNRGTGSASARELATSYRSESRRASTRSSMIWKSPTFSVRRGTPSTWAVAAMARSIWRRLGLPPRRATAAAS